MKNTPSRYAMIAGNMMMITPNTMRNPAKNLISKNLEIPAKAVYEKRLYPFCPYRVKYSRKISADTFESPIGNTDRKQASLLSKHIKQEYT